VNVDALLAMTPIIFPQPLVGQDKLQVISMPFFSRAMGTLVYFSFWRCAIYSIFNGLYHCCIHAILILSLCSIHCSRFLLQQIWLIWRYFFILAFQVFQV